MLHIQSLSGGYTRNPILKNINITIEPGKLVALVGMNGAGKSTLIQHLNTVMKPFTGSITLNGINALEDTQRYKKQIAFVPETPILYEELTFKEHIELVAQVYDMNRDQALENAKRYSKIFRLEERLEWFPSVFSKGMKQKVMLVLALMLDVPMYVIDEPFMGLDPLALKHLLAIFKEKIDAGSSILVSTHLLSQIEHLTDVVLFMHDGELIEQGTISSLLQKYNIHTVDELYSYILSGKDDY